MIVRDLRVRQELLGRVGAALNGPIDGVDLADAALVAILAAADFTLVLDRRTRRDHKRRIRELTEWSGPIGPALLERVQAAAVGA